MLIAAPLFGLFIERVLMRPLADAPLVAQLVTTIGVMLALIGLAATIWTTNLKTALDGAHRLEAGIVQVNQNLVVTSNLNYGGVKNSGLGKEATLEAMLEHFTHKKTIILNMQ